MFQNSGSRESATYLLPCYLRSATILKVLLTKRYLKLSLRVALFNKAALPSIRAEPEVADALTEEIIDQVWAEVMVRYSAGETWWLDRDKLLDLFQVGLASAYSRHFGHLNQPVALQLFVGLFAVDCIKGIGKPALSEGVYREKISY